MSTREQVLQMYREGVRESVRYVHAVTLPSGRVRWWNDMETADPLYLPLFWDVKSGGWVRHAIDTPIPLDKARQEVERINEIRPRRWRIIETEVIAMIHTRREVSDIRQETSDTFGVVVEWDDLAS